MRGNNVVNHYDANQLRFLISVVYACRQFLQLIRDTYAHEHLLKRIDYAYVAFLWYIPARS